jgi:hypothetical protein
LVHLAATNLVLARSGTKEQKAKLAPFEDLPRPWIPFSCPASLLKELLPWLEDVAGWLNHDYSWRILRPIPDCWPAHPHIVHELAGLAWLRVLADEALDPGPLEDWHRYALPSFLNRLTERLGESCSTEHDDWPGSTRHTRYWSDEAKQVRLAAFEELEQEALRLRPEQQRLPIPDPPGGQPSTDEPPLNDHDQVPD